MINSGNVMKFWIISLITQYFTWYWVIHIPSTGIAFLITTIILPFLYHRQHNLFYRFPKAISWHNFTLLTCQSFPDIDFPFQPNFFQWAEQVTKRNTKVLDSSNTGTKVLDSSNTGTKVLDSSNTGSWALPGWGYRWYLLLPFRLWYDWWNPYLWIWPLLLWFDHPGRVLLLVWSSIISLCPLHPAGVIWLPFYVHMHKNVISTLWTKQTNSIIIHTMNDYIQYIQLLGHTKFLFRHLPRL